MGVILIFFTIYNFIKYKDSTRIYIQSNESFNVENFINNTTLLKTYFKPINFRGKYLALYLINTNDCRICLKEMFDFMKYLKNNFAGTILQQLIVIYDVNVQRARWFANTIDTSLPILCGNDNNFESSLYKYNDSIEKRQLIFIDINRQRIILRVKLQKGIITSDADKKEIISLLNKQN